MIEYIKGDATNPLGNGKKIVAHIVNDRGKFGKGFALAVAKKFPIVRQKYLEWYKNKYNFSLGHVQFVTVNDYLIVANMLAQSGFYGGGKPPIRYDAARECLNKVLVKANELKASVHAPMIGSGLAKGNWAIIEEIINQVFKNQAITIYLLE